mgnify:CR=1 FL=1
MRSLATAIRYESCGDPGLVLKSGNIDTGSLGPKSVAIKMLAAPINVSDLNMIEGTYGIKAKLPAVGGNEGVGVVKGVGADVTSLNEGDWVIPSSPGFGTWRDETVVEENDVITVPNDIPVSYAATLSVNPATAYRLLRDFAQLKPGDVVMQNGANSMVGLCVIQMAREMGVKTINIVRSDRPDLHSTLRLLNNYGGDLNVPDNYVGTPEFKAIMKDMGPCKLALNCIGGDILTDMARSLTDGAKVVSYGGMSKKPIDLPSDLVSSKSLSMEGFWVTEWNSKASITERINMLNDIATMVKEEKLSLLYELYDFDDFSRALEKSKEAFRLRKIVLQIDHPDRLKEHDEKSEDEYEVFSYPVK